MNKSDVQQSLYTMLRLMASHKVYTNTVTC
ncbi:hypothetical protein SAMN05421545_0183 [Pontibacter lucknowensis]|uniref:Uncharacterized protein n=1 Tax=Pontibacter lucknowensis TaxID=1077936 RepID=A0A1N6T943_9BACT|nr:hypothetical protein SAMN05421545_0183 [Pontibacter lucknowensis]